MSYANCAAQQCHRCARNSDIVRLENKKDLGVGRTVLRRTPHMVQLLEKHLLQRLNVALLLTLVWGGLAACAIAASVYDVSRWLTGAI
jgi:hypothetical protein